MTTFKSDFEFLVNTYQNGGSTKGTARMIFHFAKVILENAEIVKNLDNAKILAKIKEHSKVNENISMEDYMSLFRVLMSNYRALIDDISIVSAFELYAKGTLFKKQYLIHEIQNPNKLKKLQTKGPIHFKTYRKYLKEQEVKLSDRTLKASLLLSNEYSHKLNLAGSTLRELKKFNDSRNKMHFLLSHAYTLDTKKLNAIQDLRSNIEKMT